MAAMPESCKLRQWRKVLDYSWLNQKFDSNSNVAFLAGVDQARFKRVVSPVINLL